MRFSIAIGALAFLSLTACQTTTGPEAANESSFLSVRAAIEARQADYAGVDHAKLEQTFFYDAVCNMTSPAQVRAYYRSQGFNMSSDGTGAAAIAALQGDQFFGRMPSKAAALLRGCRGDQSS